MVERISAPQSLEEAIAERILKTDRAEIAGMIRKGVQIAVLMMWDQLRYRIEHQNERIAVVEMLARDGAHCRAPHVRELA